MELEFKLAVSSPALLEKILFDPQIAEVRKENYRLIHMATIYYDTPDSRLQTRRWTLRLRQENARLVATLKTPAAGKARGEWECEAASIQAANPLLLEHGAPAELPEILDGEPLIPVCAAQFTRRAADVAFADGTVCEFCGDIGMLVGGANEEDLCEVEIELKSGDADTASAFAEELMERFDLQEEHRSKFARASALTRREARG
jgi:inorganic triphosphatase YgiF